MEQAIIFGYPSIVGLEGFNKTIEMASSSMQSWDFFYGQFWMEYILSFFIILLDQQGAF